MVTLMPASCWFAVQPATGNIINLLKVVSIISWAALILNRTKMFRFKINHWSSFRLVCVSSHSNTVGQRVYQRAFPDFFFIIRSSLLLTHKHFHLLVLLLVFNLFSSVEQFVTWFLKSAWKMNFITITDRQYNNNNYNKTYFNTRVLDSSFPVLFMSVRIHYSIRSATNLIKWFTFSINGFCL